MIRFFLLVFLLSWPAQAENILIDRKACQQLTQHVPAADVAYEAGVDVRGKPVVPADIAPAPDYQLLETFRMQLTVDLAGLLGIPDFPHLGREAVVGHVTLRAGEVYFNDQPLSPKAAENLAVLCIDAPRAP